MYGTLAQLQSVERQTGRVGRALIRHSSLPYKPENRASTQKLQHEDDYYRCYNIKNRRHNNTSVTCPTFRIFIVILKKKIKIKVFVGLNKQIKSVFTKQ